MDEQLCGINDSMDNSFVKSLQDSAKGLSAKPVRDCQWYVTEIMSIAQRHK